MPETSSRSPGLLLTALCAAGMLAATMQTAVVPILGNIGDQTGASPGALSWIVTANLLSSAVTTPLFGRLGDLRGKRGAMLLCLLLMLAGSVLAAITTSLPLLVLARVLQGAVTGVFPLALSVARDTVPRERLTGAMALISATLSIGGSIGLVAAGLLASDGADYRNVFWLASAVGVLALGAVAAWVPADTGRSGGGLDWAGALLLGGALVLVLLPLSQGGAWGWSSPVTLTLFAAAPVALACWVLLERRVDAPLVDVRMLTRRTFLLTNVTAVLMGFAMFGLYLGVSDFVQMPSAQAGYGFTASVLSAATVYLLPAALVSLVAAPVGGILVKRYSGRAVLAVSGLAGLAGFGSLTLWHGSTAAVIAGALVAGGSLSLAYAAMPALVVQSVPAARTGIANSINSIGRSVGASAAGAVVAALLVATTRRTTGLPAESGFTWVFALSATAGALTACAALLIPRTPAAVVSGAAPAGTAAGPTADTAAVRERG
ncbi:MFS transporter [Streptomyces niveiscabiei]|uniref:MFS transporter n=1 Tax=Streptomyces niveiscabiei TaxID=164115 RepID=UPI0029B02B8D|nr:MFS transporter [Streptomyces niveiscabiei]MDX3382216.1 MFS transporter [Streptomyces niveiscabiei]